MYSAINEMKYLVVYEISINFWKAEEIGFCNVFMVPPKVAQP